MIFFLKKKKEKSEQIVQFTESTIHKRNDNHIPNGTPQSE
jgi:hypothetical protein